MKWLQLHSLEVPLSGHQVTAISKFDVFKIKKLCNPTYGIHTCKLVVGGVLRCVHLLFPGQLSVDTLQFLLFLYIQQLNKISLRTSLIGEEWPSPRSRPQSPSFTERTSCHNKVSIVSCKGNASPSLKSMCNEARHCRVWSKSNKNPETNYGVLPEEPKSKAANH